MPNNKDGREVGLMWDQRFREHGWSEVPDPSLVELADGLEVGRALDLGSGPGRNGLWLARQGWAVTEVDASQVALDMVAVQASREGLAVSVELADLSTYRPLSLSFDLVVVANIHLLPSERDQFFAMAAGAVAPGGYLYLIGHHVDAYGLAGPPMRERLFEESLFHERFTELAVELLERRETQSDAGDTNDVSLLLWARRRDN